MSSSMQQHQVKWRRAKVLELMSKGETNQAEIARILQVDRSIVCRDVAYLRQQAKENISKYVDERLPEEYEKCLVGLNSILKEAWSMSQTDDSVKGDKIKALALAKDCYAMKLELLTNATVVHDAIRFVASKQKEMGEMVIENYRSSLEQIDKSNIDFQKLHDEKQTMGTSTTNNTF